MPENKEDRKEEKLAKERADSDHRFAVIDESSGLAALAGVFNAESDAKDHIDRLIAQREQSGEFVADRLFIAKLGDPLRPEVAKKHEEDVQAERKDFMDEVRKDEKR